MNPISTIELAAVPRTDLALTMVKVEAAVAAAAPFNTVLRETRSFFFIVFSSNPGYASLPAREASINRPFIGASQAGSDAYPEAMLTFSGSLLRAKLRRLFCCGIH